MASSSPLPLSFPSSSSSQNWEHDVFPSFHGPDVRETFLSHFLKEFRSKGINLFIDNDIPRGKPIGPELKRAIRGSKIAIVLLSKNYASSSWCLDELVEIMKKELGQTVITIFYEVDPTVVKKQSGDFGKAFKETCKGKTKEKIETWRKALEDVSTIAGYHSSNRLWANEAAMIENIANDISKMLHLTPSPGFDHLIGMGDHIKRRKLTPTSGVGEMPTWPTVGQEEILETAWNRLMEDRVQFMGLHGMGGVGKTTLFKKLNNKFVEIAGRFDVVIWVVVSQGAKISKLQDDIAQKLHLCGDEWRNKNESDKASYIYRVLKGKRFVLMLDDIWEKVDLEAIGVPCPTRENGCKVVFTTRSHEVCGRMGDHEPIEIKCLKRDEAWELFKSKVGDTTLRRDPVIVELARKVTEKCHGLPLALNIIGEAMATKTAVQEWKDAIDILTTSAAEFSDMENKILPILRFSYDSLVDEHIKSCFLYCALFPEDYQISKQKLIDYWICEGFIGEGQVIKRATNKGHGVLGTLIRGNLLMEVDTRKVVMHDVVREMALWIASDFGKQKETFVVQAKVGLREIPKVKDWGAVRRMSLMSNDIEEITCTSKCSQLTTLFLQNNYKLKNLSGEFIRSMQKLVVLDLTYNQSLKKLPEQISELASLQFLDLSHTSIEQLPVGFQELKKLTHLDLTWTMRLCSVSGISKLSSLRALKLKDSKVDGDVSLVKELQLLEHLQVLTINISTELGLKQLSDDQRLANCTTGLFIMGFQQQPFDISFDISLLGSMKNLRLRWVKNSHVWEINTYIKFRESFTNLSSLQIFHCKGIKDLTWLLFAPNIVSLRIVDSDDVEEIINKEKATNLTDITPFLKLESLELSDLPKLESIYWSPLPFPFLKKIRARKCPKLRKLPLNATSVPRLEEFEIVMAPEEQKTELEWEDEDTKNRFLPLIKEWRRF